MSAYDWSQFKLRIPIKASLQKIYDCWTIPFELETWFLRQASFITQDGVPREKNLPIASDDTYTWLWHGYADTVMEKGEVSEANGHDRLRFRFGNAGEVTVTMYFEESASICQLVQSNIRLDEISRINYHIGCMNGWNFYLANLKSIIEGGIDLRNKNEKLTRVVNS